MLVYDLMIGITLLVAFLFKAYRRVCAFFENLFRINTSKILLDATEIFGANFYTRMQEKHFVGVVCFGFILYTVLGINARCKSVGIL